MVSVTLLLYGDADKNGDVTVSDALRILQKAVGKNDSFPAEKQFLHKTQI